jgi:hypothetical protein
MIRYILRLFSSISNRPLQPAVSPGTWYFQTGKKDKPVLSIVLTLSQDDCDFIFLSKGKNYAWLALIEEQITEEYRGSFHKSYHFADYPQWFQINPLNAKTIVNHSRNGVGIRELRRLDRSLTKIFVLNGEHPLNV